MTDAKLSDALDELCKALGGGYAEGQYWTYEAVLEAARRLNKPLDDTDWNAGWAAGTKAALAANEGKCIDCGQPTKLGPGSARCPACWEDRCGAEWIREKAKQEDGADVRAGK